MLNQHQLPTFKKYPGVPQISVEQPMPAHPIVYQFELCCVISGGSAGLHLKGMGH